MRDPTTVTNLGVKELIKIAIERLNDRRLANTLAYIEQLRLELLDAAIARGTKTGESRQGARKRGRPPQRHDRHMQIASAVAMLVEDAGLHPLRSHVSRRRDDPSACSIVAAALEQLGEHLPERTVEGIWNRHRRSAVRIHQKVRDRNTADRP